MSPNIIDEQGPAGTVYPGPSGISGVTPAALAAPRTASYVVATAEGELLSERVLTAGAHVTLTDAGAGTTLTVDVPTAPTVALKTSDQLAIGAAFADVTGLGLAVAANVPYAFEFVLIVDADATTTGMDFAVNGPAAPTLLNYEQVYWTSATVRTVVGAVAYDNDTAATDSNGTDKRMVVVRGILLNGANAGTLIARAKREAVGTGPNVRAGSYARLWKLN